MLDECDELLASKFQLVYAWGSQELLPAMTERINVLQSVLQTLQHSTIVEGILAHAAIAQVQHHEGRHGGMPEVRLLAGTIHLPSRLTKTMQQLLRFITADIPYLCNS